LRGSHPVVQFLLKTMMTTKTPRHQENIGIERMNHQDAKTIRGRREREKGGAFPSQVVFLVSLCLAGLWLFPAGALAATKSKTAGPVTVPELELEGGRKLLYEGSVSNEREVKNKRSFWAHVLDVVAGEPSYHALINPYSVVTDSKHRLIVTDPGAGGVHIF